MKKLCELMKSSLAKELSMGHPLILLLINIYIHVASIQMERLIEPKMDKVS